MLIINKSIKTNKSFMEFISNFTMAVIIYHFKFMFFLMHDVLYLQS